MYNAQSINTKLSIYSFIETIKRVSYIMIMHISFSPSRNIKKNRKNRLDVALKTYTYNNIIYI